MSNAFTNFLGNVASGLLGKSDGDLRDYQHANRLYVQNNYDRSPKVGFLYFVNFNVNKDIISKLDPSYIARGLNDVGFLAKKVDLPKFKISTETLNQYNRKTVVQTKIQYNDINIDLKHATGSNSKNINQGSSNNSSFHQLGKNSGTAKSKDCRRNSTLAGSYGIHSNRHTDRSCGS